MKEIRNRDMLAAMTEELNPVTELRRLLDVHGLTQVELASKIGIANSLLCMTLQGRVNPGPRVLAYLKLERVVSYRRTA